MITNKQSLKQKIQNIANAIKTRSGSNSSITLDAMPGIISAIQSEGKMMHWANVSVNNGGIGATATITFTEPINVSKSKVFLIFYFGTTTPMCGTGIVSNGSIAVYPGTVGWSPINQQPKLNTIDSVTNTSFSFTCNAYRVEHIFAFVCDS